MVGILRDICVFGAVDFVAVVIIAVVAAVGIVAATKCV